MDKEIIHSPPEGRSVLIPAERAILNGKLTLPKEAVGLVVLIQCDDHNCPHTSNDAVAKACHRYRLATLLVDLPSFAEGHSPDVFLSEKSIEHIALWLQQNAETAALLQGLFVTGTSTSAALITAARCPDLVKALVLCGGRPELSMDLLPRVKAPVLLIAGGRDPSGLRAHQSVLEKLNSDSTLHVIPRALHLFEESDPMEEAAQLAALWFSRHLG